MPAACGSRRVFCGALPAIVVLLLFVSAIEDDAVAFDFRVFYGAAEAILDGESPYQDPEDENAVGRAATSTRRSPRSRRSR